MQVTITVQFSGVTLAGTAGTVGEACYALYTAYLEAGYGNNSSHYSNYATVEQWVKFAFCWHQGSVTVHYA